MGNPLIESHGQSLNPEPWAIPKSTAAGNPSGAVFESIGLQKSGEWLRLWRAASLGNIGKRERLLLHKRYGNGTEMRPAPHKGYSAAVIRDSSSHRSHFGSRYKLGCCGHAGLFGRGRDIMLRGIIIHLKWNALARLAQLAQAVAEMQVRLRSTV